jgi:hypothetical protein
MNRWYYLKKSFSLYPGTRAPVSASFLRPYYAGRQAERSWARAGLDALTGAAFRLWVPFRARSVAKRYNLGPDWARRAAAIGRERFADPNDLALFRIEQPADLDGFMRRFEYAAISKRLNPRCWRDDCALADKLRFYARCTEKGLASPELLAAVSNGNVEVRRVPHPAMLAVKPSGGEGGSGFRLLDWKGGDDAAFQAFLKATPGLGRGRWVVQAKVSPHPDLAPISLSALPTARITTIRDEQGEPEIVTSVLRFPSVREALVDNIKAGGLMAPIDPATGTLGRACRGKTAGEISTHPVTGAAVEGLRLPDWDAAVTLVLRAHREGFPEYLMVGWDVAFSPAGRC